MLSLAQGCSSGLSTASARMKVGELDQMLSNQNRAVVQGLMNMESGVQIHIEWSEVISCFVTFTRQRRRFGDSQPLFP